MYVRSIGLRSGKALGIRYTDHGRV